MEGGGDGATKRARVALVQQRPITYSTADWDVMSISRMKPEVQHALCERKRQYWVRVSGEVPAYMEVLADFRLLQERANFLLVPRQD